MALLIMFWFAVTAAMTFAPGATQAATIIFPTSALMNNLPDSVSVLRWDRATASVTSEDRDFVRRLYAKGAFLVLPERKAGCLELDEPPLRAGTQAKNSLRALREVLAK